MLAYNATPVVLTFNLHDPTGRVGIQADIETIASLGGHGVSVVTDLCAQDTQTRIDHRGTDITMLVEQARAILEDLVVTGVLIGHCANHDQVQAIHTLLIDYPAIPVAIDLNMLFSNDDLDVAMTCDLLVPFASFAIIGSTQLALATDHPDCEATMASELIDGTDMKLLVCHSDSRGSAPVLYAADQQPAVWPVNGPIPSQNSFACVAAAGATIMAHGVGIKQAIGEAIAYSISAAHASRQLGMGQTIPNRLFWTDTNDTVDSNATGTN